MENLPLDQLTSKISALRVSAEYKLTWIGIKVMVHTKPERDRVCFILKYAKVKFFTHDFSGEKLFKAVIRGINNDDPKKIQAELRNRYKLDATAVYKMAWRDEIAKKYQDCLYLVHFCKISATLNGLQADRTIVCIIIR